MTRRQVMRRILAATIISAQLLLVVRAYSADHAFFGFQMFPESSEWQATIERQLPDGTLVDVRRPWPGGYAWGDLVQGRGLGDPFSRHHADTGLDSTLDFFGSALEWVAVNTPADFETTALIATVTVWHNGRTPESIRFEVQR